MHRRSPSVQPPLDLPVECDWRQSRDPRVALRLAAERGRAAWRAAAPDEPPIEEPPTAERPGEPATVVDFDDEAVLAQCRALAAVYRAERAERFSRNSRDGT